MIRLCIIAMFTFGALLTAPASALAQDANAATAPVAERFSITVESGALERRVAFGAPQFRQVGRFTMVQVQAQNVSSRQQSLEYKIEWFDRDGFSVQTTSTWLPMILTPSAHMSVQSVGQVATAYSARLTLRDPERTR